MTSYRAEDCPECRGKESLIDLTNRIYDGHVVTGAPGSSDAGLFDFPGSPDFLRGDNTGVKCRKVVSAVIHHRLIGAFSEIGTESQAHRQPEMILREPGKPESR
jgi:hypothetical protein